MIEYGTEAVPLRGRYYFGYDVKAMLRVLRDRVHISEQIPLANKLLNISFLNADAMRYIDKVYGLDSIQGHFRIFEMSLFPEEATAALFAANGLQVSTAGELVGGTRSKLIEKEG
ncbi:hypothetical protein LCGC14_0384260 [marine sediment metagenome]|uniref:Uncharacterized protein n=1 Tax=marine sediment metagenome TaxID=412755 RepID=A0A0F9TJH1_9ZZZZ